MGLDNIHQKLLTRVVLKELHPNHIAGKTGEGMPPELMLVDIDLQKRNGFTVYYEQRFFQEPKLRVLFIFTQALTLVSRFIKPKLQ